MPGGDGVPRGFANSRRHRGARPVPGSGARRALSRPRHGWSYARDRSPIAAAGMEKTGGFDRADHGPAPVRLAERAGFVFADLAGDGARAFDSWFPDRVPGPA